MLLGVGVGVPAQIIGSSSASAVGAATKIVLTTAAVGTASGSPFTVQPQLTLQDASGLTVTGSSLTITVSFTGYLYNGASPTEKFIGTQTATINTSTGIATFPADFGFSGIAGRTYTISFKSTGLTSATQSITVTPGLASKLAITKASAGTTSSAAFTTQPQISVQDSGNNTITGTMPVVTATVNAGSLVGTQTATVDAGTGVASFTDLGIT